MTENLNRQQQEVQNALHKNKIHEMYVILSYCVVLILYYEYAGPLQAGALEFIQFETQYHNLRLHVYS